MRKWSGLAAVSTDSIASDRGRSDAQAGCRARTSCIDGCCQAQGIRDGSDVIGRVGGDERERVDNRHCSLRRGWPTSCFTLWVHGALEEWRAAAGAALVDEDDRRCDRRGEGTSLPGSGRTTRPRRPSPPGMWKTAVLAPLTLWPMMVAWSWTLARDLGTNHPVTVPHRTISSSPSTRPNAESIRPARRPQVREPCMPEARGERGGFASFTRAVAIVRGFKLVRPL